MFESRYHTVPDAMVHERWRRDLSDAERVLADYLVLCRHATTIGVYQLPLPYMAHDLGWTLAKVRRTIEKLIARQLVAYDAVAEWVFVPYKLAHLRVSNGDHGKSLQTWAAAVPAAMGFYRTFVESWNALVERAGRWLTALADASAEGGDTVSTPCEQGADTVSTGCRDNRNKNENKNINLQTRGRARAAADPVDKRRQASLMLPINGGMVVPEEARQGAEAAGAASAPPTKRQNWLNKIGRDLLEHGAAEERMAFVLLQAKPEPELTRAEKDQLNRWSSRMRLRERAA